MNIAVVGSGIAGLACAYLLQRRHDVTLFEADTRLGGHSNTVFVPTAQGEQPVDTGFIVFNACNYPNLTALFHELDVATQEASMSFSVSLGNGALEWKGSDNLFTVFAQPRNLFRISHWRMLADILRLNRRARALLASGESVAGSLGDFLARERFGAALASRYLLPMAGMIWSCSPRQAADYPAEDFLRFFEAHGLLTATRQPQWRSVVGGSQVYVKKIRERLQGGIRIASPVRQLRREAGAVSVSTAAGSERFDAVVSACHADQALRLLADASALECRVLGGIPYVAQRKVVLHTDDSFMPRRRRAWASWNYLHPRDEVHDQDISGSYWMNPLQSIPGPRDYFVTLNPRAPIAPEKILYETRYEHPFYSAAAAQTHRLLPQIQGRAGIWWAGAWCGYGFHEDGLKSALRVARAFGCAPAWASGLDEARGAATAPVLEPALEPAA